MLSVKRQNQLKLAKRKKMTNEQVECKAGVYFLKIEVFGESQHLNPFRININQIRYIRSYNDVKGDCWAVIVGEKMFPTRSLDFDNVKVGEIVKLGNTEFECEITTSLTEKDKYKTLVNYNNVLYTRKYLKKGENNKYLENDNNNNKNVNKIVKSSDNLDKFAIITVDERIIPVINELESDGRSNNEFGGSEASTRVPVENM